MKIEHVALYVKDLEKAKEFFIRYFNGTANAIYHNKEKGFRSYFITFDDGARMEIMTRPDVDDRRNVHYEAVLRMLPSLLEAKKKSTASQSSFKTTASR